MVGTNIESDLILLPLWRNKDFRKTVSYKKVGGGVINELSHDLDILNEFI